MRSPRLEILRFTDLRSDWYASNSAVPRAIRLSRLARRRRMFIGFPRQWIPTFEWFGVEWSESVAPPQYVPIFSDASEEQVIGLVDASRRKGMLRSLLEAVAVLDPILSDCLYRLDQNDDLTTEMLRQELDQQALAEDQTESKRRKSITLNGWQSYGRAAVRAIEALANAVPANSSTAVILPCSLSRPYDRSPIHRKLRSILLKSNIAVHAVDAVVVTSLGVLPRSLWSHPAVLAYDAGVPDIYRTLRLLRSYFAKRRYKLVVDCLQYEPYSDLLRILAREGYIPKLHRLRETPNRRQYVKKLLATESMLAALAQSVSRCA